MKKGLRPGSRFVEIILGSSPTLAEFYVSVFTAAVELYILVYYLSNYANVLSLEKVHSKEFPGYSLMVNLHRIKAFGDFRINEVGG